MKITRRKMRLVIYAGMILTLIPLFHHNLWFDEAYTVGMVSRSFRDIYAIGIHDVHPLLYYYCLKVFTFPFPDKILAERLFSWGMLCLLGWFGYFKVTKEYGEKTGFLFSFLVLFFPCNMVYAGEIRMYTMVMLLVCIAAVYLDLIIHGKDSLHNRMLFVLFCLLSAYTHYYGLLSAAIMNLILLIHDISYKKMKSWFTGALIEIGGYAFWLPVLFAQTTAVRENFWIEWKWPQSLFDLILFVFTGNLDESVYLPAVFGIILSALIVLVLMMSYNRKTWVYPLVYAGVIGISAAAGILMHRVILYPRYLLVVQGCLLLWIAWNGSYADKRVLAVLICLCVMDSTEVCHTLCADNYDPGNQEVLNQVKQEIRPDDQILITNTGQNAGSFAFFTELGRESALYENTCDWSDESILAYRALGDFRIVDDADLQKQTGRIWYIFCSDSEKHLAQYADEGHLNNLFQEKPSAVYRGHGKYKGFYYAAYLYQLPA